MTEVLAGAFFWQIWHKLIKIKFQTSIEPNNGAFYSNKEVSDQTLGLVLVDLFN